MREAIPRVVIVGGGFGGLAAAKALEERSGGHHPDRPRESSSVPAAALSSGDFGAWHPGRSARRSGIFFGNNSNTTVILGEVTGVDKDKKCVFVNDADRAGVPIAYDFLVLATGVTHSYFGHDEFAQFAPGLKSSRRRCRDPQQDPASVRTGRSRGRSQPPSRSLDFCAGRRGPNRSGNGRRDCRAGPQHIEVGVSAHRS